MTIRAKQIRTGTFDATAAGRAPFGTDLFDPATVANVFADDSIGNDQLAADAVNVDQLATTAFGDGLTGGGGSAVEVQPNTTDGAGVPGVEVSANGLRLAAPQPSTGLTGGAGSALAVDPDTGIVITASGVAFDTSANLDMSVGGGVHTHSPTTLQVVGTPANANDGVNKAYVDNSLSGITWRAPVKVIGLLGEATIATINGLTPAQGDAVVALDAGTPTAGTSDALVIGDLAEFDGTSWIKVFDAAAGRLPNDLRLILSTTSALLAPFTDGVDDGRLVVSVADPGTFNGTVSDYDDTGDASDGNAVLVQCPPGNSAPSTFENNGYVFDGAVPTGSWIQFTGAGQLNAGAGLTLSGNTLNVGDVNRGVQVNPDDLEIDASESAGNGLAQNSTNSWQFDVQPNNTDDGGVSGLEVAANGVRVAASAAGAGLAGGGGDALAVGDADRGVQVNADDLEIDASEIAPAGSGLKAGSNSWELNVEPADFAGTGLEDDGADNLRLAAQGNGIAGGAGSVLSVQPDNTTGGDVAPTTVGANGVGVDVTDLDADHAVIDWVPSNYTRDDSPAEAQSLQDLTAHLKGIDDQFGLSGGTPRQEVVTSENVTGTDTALADTLANTPISNASVKLYLNGILQRQGAGQVYTVSGTTITWLAGSGTAVDLDTLDEILVTYES